MTIAQIENGVRFVGQAQEQCWDGPIEAVAFDDAGIRKILLNLDQSCYVVRDAGRIGLTNEGRAAEGSLRGRELLATASAVSPERLGDPVFRQAHGVRLAYASGSMASGIASEDLVIAMGREKLLSSFGAAGLMPAQIQAAIERIQQALPNGPYAFNLIHSPSEERLERGAVELYLNRGIRTVEASAFLDLTPHVVRYRAAGLALDRQGRIEIRNKVIAKLSRREVASKFMQSAPARLLGELLQQGLITEQQANMAVNVPMADDVTVEADSGGHTDNRPLVCLLPSILELRDETQAKYGYTTSVRVGAAGGIGTPASVLAAFMMGAGYVVTGSVNQSTLEAGTSAHTKKLLSQADMADVMMAPAADMFEMGVKVQLLKRGTMFPMRAQKLYELYSKHNTLEEIPAAEREKLEAQVFKRKLDDVWADTVAFFMERDPDQIARAKDNPKRKMALVFRWYLGLSSRWSVAGEQGRELDYQVWCGPAMGAFNDWVRGSYLEDPANRHVTDVAWHMMRGAAYLYRIHSLKMHGVQLAAEHATYKPMPQV